MRLERERPLRAAVDEPERVLVRNISYLARGTFFTRVGPHPHARLKAAPAR
jgi:hypothetical protein